ncbi:MAG: hypothetical protein ACYTBJ_19830 [Planctomycetota bacterium]|jgi:hypothetical protein
MTKQKIDLSQFDEPRLVAICKRVLAPSFDLQSEVTGKYIIDGSRVRIDLLAMPNKNLIDRGFVPEPIGVEIKSPASKNGSAYAFAWQSVTYALSEFNGIRPAFVVMFPSADHFWKHERAVHMQQFLQFANVGQLKLGAYRDNWDEWSIAFNVNYFHSARGLGAIPNAALKRRSGNSG